MSHRCGRFSAGLLHAACLAVVGALGFTGTSLAQTLGSWPSAGGDLQNSHSALSPNGPTQINPSTVSRLALKWSYQPSGDISATPTVEPGGLYVPDWNGYLYKLDPSTGALLWKHLACDYSGTCNTARMSIVRTAPAIGNNVLVIGDSVAHDNVSNYGAVVMGVDKTTGGKLWSTIVNNSSRYASVLGSPIIYNLGGSIGEVAYVGTASWEEGVAGSNPSYQPVFRGNVTALNANTGQILWQFTSVPPGYAGGPFPGSTMAVWPAQHALLASTGNNYTVPPSVSSCVIAAGNSDAAQLACLDPTNYVNALVSLDLATGKLNWGRRMAGADTFTVACWLSPPVNCPVAGSDSDFAQGPMLTWLPNFQGVPDDRGGTSNSYMLAAGQKNSIFYAVNPYNGGLFWSTFIGTGGIEWGSTENTDDFNLFYAALHNPQHVPQTIAGQSVGSAQPGTNPLAWNAGAWTALDTRTGKTIWTVPTYGNDLTKPGQGGEAPGCMTFTNRVVFAGSTSGYMVALNALTGYRYWAFPTGTTIVSCPAIYNDTVFWGVGYSRHGVGQWNGGGHMLYAFAIPPS